MPLDAYSPCPGGLNKKVKFCCSDLVPELDKVHRMLEGDQRLAALDYLDKLEAKYSERQCLLALKMSVLASLERLDDLRAVTDKFVSHFPTNPIALAERALFAIKDKGPEAGVACLQDAWEQINENVPRQVYDALGAMAIGLLAANRPMSALAHVFLQSVLDREDEAPMALIGRVMASPQVALLIKDDELVAKVPDGAAWRGLFETAMQEAAHGRWRRAANQLDRLTTQYPDAAEAWQNLATLSGWLANHSHAVFALRKLSRLPLAFDDAVAVEGLAQTLDQAEGVYIDLLLTTYPLVDIDRAVELLLSDDRFAQMPVERMPEGANEPPPRVEFAILDRRPPRTGAGIQLGDIPRVIGNIRLFGKQTDREARLELEAFRGEEQAGAQQTLAAAAGATIGAAGEPAVVDKMLAAQHAMSANWRLPDDTPRERVRELSDEFTRANLLERWPMLPNPALDNKSPEQLKDDPAQRLRLAAAILIVELAAEQNGQDGDFAALRRKLNVPEPAAVDAAQVDVAKLRLFKLIRLPVEALADEQLVPVYQRAYAAGIRRLLRRAAVEIIKRPGLEAQIDFAEVYRTLIALSGPTDEALAYIETARNHAVKQNKSTALWDLEELGVRLSRFEPAEVPRLIEHIAREHGREPGVRQALGELLAAAGLVGSDGRLRMPAGPAPQDAAVAAAEPEPNKIWTPDSERGAGEGSKLWVPGMD